MEVQVINSKQFLFRRSIRLPTSWKSFSISASFRINARQRPILPSSMRLFNHCISIALWYDSSSLRRASAIAFFWSSVLGSWKYYTRLQIDSFKQEVLNYKNIPFYNESSDINSLIMNLRLRKKNSNVCKQIAIENSNRNV